MKTTTLNGQKRTEKVNVLRNNGLVPCVLYGGKENINFSVDIREFKKIIFTPNTYQIILNIDKVEYKTIFQAQQFHPVSDKIIHADFLQVEDDKVVRVNLPVILTGIAVGVKNGGRLVVNHRNLKLRGKLSDIPNEIEIDISKLKIGESVKVKDIFIENIVILDAPNDLIVAVKTSRKAVSIEETDEDEEGGNKEESSEA